MIVYIHNALMVPILHDYKYFNSLPFCHAMLLYAILAQFKTKSKHGGLGVWMSFSDIFLWGHWHLVNSVLDVLHISIYVKPHCIIKAVLSFMLSPTHTDTQTHNSAHQTLNCTTSLQIFEDSLLSSVLWIYSTVTDLAKFLGKSTCKNIREANLKIQSIRSLRLFNAENTTDTF